MIHEFQICIYLQSYQEVLGLSDSSLGRFWRVAMHLLFTCNAKSEGKFKVCESVEWTEYQKQTPTFEMTQPLFNRVEKVSTLLAGPPAHLMRSRRLILLRLSSRLFLLMPIMWHGMPIATESMLVSSQKSKKIIWWTDFCCCPKESFLYRPSWSIYSTSSPSSAVKVAG